VLATGDGAGTMALLHLHLHLHLSLFGGVPKETSLYFRRVALGELSTEATEAEL
jgi:hypothetical protein